MLRTSRVLAACLGLVACQREPSPPPPPVPVVVAAPAPAPIPAVVIAAGADSVLDTARVPDGGLVVTLPRMLLRFAKGKTAEATAVPLPERVDWSATARDADVTLLVSPSGNVYVATGATVRKILTVNIALRSHAVADDGRAIVLDEYVDSTTEASLPPGTVNGASQRRVVYDVTGKRLSVGSAMGIVELDPQARFMATDRKVVPLDGGDSIAVPKAFPLGWAGDHVMYLDENGKSIFVVSPKDRKTTRVPICSGVPRFDRRRGRAVAVCDREVMIVDGATGKSTRVPLAVPAAAELVGINPAFDNDHLYAAFTIVPRRGDWQFDIDPNTGKATSIPPNKEVGTRGWDERENAEQTLPPVVSVKGAGAHVRVDGDGIDIESSDTPARFGPGAPSAKRIVPEGSYAGSRCGSLHAPVTTGELWFESKGEARPQACVCRDHECRETPKGPFLAGIGGGGDSLVLAAWGLTQETQIHVTDLEGVDRNVIMRKGHCHAGVTRDDGKVAGIVCRPYEKPYDSPAELVQLDLETGKQIASTRLPVNPPTNVLALAPKSVFVVVNDSTTYELDAATGKPLVTIYPHKAGAILQAADGHIELSGDETPTKNAIWCVENGVARPFESCEASVRVRDRYRVAD